jgi:hypothetical protein
MQPEDREAWPIVAIVFLGFLGGLGLLVVTVLVGL